VQPTDLAMGVSLSPPTTGRCLPATRGLAPDATTLWCRAVLSKQSRRATQCDAYKCNRAAMSEKQATLALAFLAF